MVATVHALAIVVLTGCHGGDNPSGSTGTTKAAGTCADPIVLAGATSLADESTAKASDGLSGEDTSCLGYKTHGSDQVYKIQVPSTNQAKLHVTVTPKQTPGPDAFDPVVYVTENCTVQPQCSAAADSYGGGHAESVDYVNTGSQTKDVYVVVDGYDFQPGGGQYKLAVELGAP